MESAVKNRVLKIAKNVRVWAEKEAKARMHEENLCGTCGVASVELYKRLRKNNVPVDVKIATSYSRKHCGHVFLIIDDSYVLDVTATQFGMREIEFREITGNLIRTKKFWKPRRIHTSMSGLLIQQAVDGWPSDQMHSGE